jgi:TM2 domain-containing membrane protein YozV
MRLNVKAALLSGFVLPGLGQLKAGKKVKGAILLSLVNLFFLGAIFVALTAVGQIVAAKSGAGAPDYDQLLNRLRSESPFGKWLLAGFALLWLYGFFDALLDRSDEDQVQKAADH